MKVTTERLPPIVRINTTCSQRVQHPIDELLLCYHDLTRRRYDFIV
jgi:hypothetical protein